jgi:NAD(P)-dependent dehydrogenase (short-subunit alcohol dehydrogenase family)
MALLDGKVAIVTGSAHGIGRGHALELAKHGAKVVVNDLGCTVRGDGASEQDADAVVQLIKERGGEAVADYSDVADFEAAGRMIQTAVDSFGKLDIVVNNAGIIRDAMVFNMSEADFDSVVRVHLKGTFCPTHHAAVYWRNESKEGRPVAGRIINTTSGAGLEGNVGQANYASAKAGIAAMTITTSLELLRYGVTVNCVAPAGATRIAGTMGRAELQAKEPDDFTEYSPLDPSNSSPLVAWLASDEAAHITGQVLRAVGESIIRMTPWDYGRTIEKPGERWTVEELGHKINAHLYGVRNPGLRSL